MNLTVKYNKRTDGSITVFLSLILLLVLSVICTTIEFTRVSSADTRSSEITYMSLDSCFSAYAREVFEDYGIMVLWQSENEFLSSYQNYVLKNSDYRKDFITYPVDLLSIRHKYTDIDDMVMAVDGDGELIEKQIYKYMKAAVAEDVIEELINKSTTLSQGDKLNGFNDKMERCSETLINVEGSVAGIYDNIKTVKECEINPSDVLLEMKKKLEEIKSIPSDDDYNRAVRDNLFEIYKQEFRKYAEWEEKNQAALRNVLIHTNEYFVNSTKAKTEINEIKSELEESRNEYQKEFYDVIYEELNIIDEQILSLDMDNYNVINNKQNVIEQKRIVDNVVEDMSQIMEEMKELDYSGNKISNYNNADTLIYSMYECIVKAVADIEGYCKDCMNVNYEVAQGEKKKNGVVEFVKQIKKDGLLNYVAKGEVSKKEINTSVLPSKTSELNGGIEWDRYDNATETIRKAFIGQYIFDKFQCYTDDGEVHCMDYEIEYILEGKSSDKDNLNQVVNKIIAIREGFNLVYLMKDSAKREEAYAMAAAITGFTGMPVVIRVTQFLILGAWAYAESVVDVKDLLEGYRVSVMKNSDEWNLSLSGIKNLVSTDENKENRRGLTYEDYLRFLLFSQDKSQQIYRILDVIELNVRQKYNDNFHFSECIVGVEVYTQYEVKRLFSGINFVKGMIHDRKNFFIDVSRKYSY